MEKMLATMTTKPNYESEIIKIVKGNGSPKVILNQLENYHGSDLYSLKPIRLKPVWSI